jgi:serine/threonine protein kinase
MLKLQLNEELIGSSYIYEFCSTLQESPSTTVYSATALTDGDEEEEFVVKKIMTSSDLHRAASEEVRKMRFLDHPNILKVSEVVDTQDSKCIITEKQDMDLRELLESYSDRTFEISELVEGLMY